MYHAHVGFQVATAYAPLIVEEANALPYRYDEEIVLTFGDYYHKPDQGILQGLDAKPFQWLGEPQSLVVNGHALGSCDASSSFGCTKDCHHLVVPVKPDKTYRVRIIGITALTYLYIGIENHPELDVIEADGGYLRPARTDHMRLHSGQRYSFLLKTKSVSELQKLGSKRDFWGRIESRWRPTRDQGGFVLRYQDDALDKAGGLSHTKLPSSKDFDKLVPLPGETAPWLEDKFEPLDVNEKAPRADQVNRKIIIQGQQLTLADKSIHWFVNGVKYVETQPNMPFLAQAYLTPLKPNYQEAEKHNGFDPKLKVYPIKFNDVVEIVFLNLASSAKVAEAHPWHIHGQKAFVVGRGTGPFKEAAFRASEANSPRRYIQRDTEVVFAGTGASYSNTTVSTGDVTGWMVMRLRARDPGAFLFHCHTQPHAAMGMAGVLLIAVDQLPPLPAEVRQNYGRHIPEALKVKKQTH